MGGEQVQTRKLTDEEIIARVIEVGRNAHVANPHTVWCVEDPSPTGPTYRDRSEVDNICYALPVGHLERFPIPELKMVGANMAFYPYQFREEAVEDALTRLAKAGRRCRLCYGVVHPASGCQYSETFIVCGTCIQPYVDVIGKLPKAGLPGWLQNWTAAKSSRRLRDRHPDALGFYQSAGLFLGQDTRRVRV